MREGREPHAYVRLTDPAIEDLDRLVRHDPQVARQALKKMLLLERDPHAGSPLLGDLIGFRKLTVGDRHWRIVWRVTTNDAGDDVVEIAEVWAARARSDGDVYAEMATRLDALPATPKTQALADVIETFGRAAGGLTAARHESREPVPEWLASRLIHTAGMTADQVDALTPELAMQAWEEYITRPDT
jgi:mRNA interferase RelE/StbE